jgi:uncharacterized protein (TIGR01777 family)
MRIAITGSTGLIGRHLTRALLERGDSVIAFSRPSSNAVNVPIIRWDPELNFMNAADLTAVGQLDAVVHLAGAGVADRRWTSRRKALILESRTRSTELLAARLGDLASPPQILLSSSAIGYYGSCGAKVLTEQSPTGSGFLAEVCQAWEGATSSLRGSDIVVTTARTGIVLTADGGALGKQLPLFKAGLGGQLGSGEQFVSSISLDDQIRAMLFLLEHPTPGPVNLVGPDPVTNKQFTHELATLLHRPALFRVPRVALAAALGAELCDEALLASQRVRPEVLLQAGFDFRHPTNALALAAALA